MKDDLALYVVAGPLKGSRYEVTEAGLRLGRSSNCGISIKDPALSRNNSLFELRDGALWVTDLASSNGTFVNGEELGSEPRLLKKGDMVEAGDCAISVGMDRSPKPLPDAEPPPVAPEPKDDGDKIDLGLVKCKVAPEEAPPLESKPARQGTRLFLWGLVAVLLAVAGVSWLLVAPYPGASEPSRHPGANMRETKADAVLALSYEKVEASTEGIYRYLLEFSDATGELSIKIDSIPKDERHVSESKRLDAKARAEFERILSPGALYALDREYSAPAPKPGSLQSFSMRIVRTGRVFSTEIVDAMEPEAFKDARTALETFAQNELGIWAIQYPAAKLIEMSRESESTADAKYAEQDVGYGNLYAALEEYNKAIYCLQTVEPKPASYPALIDKQQRTSAELDRRYAERSFFADRAISIGDWETARAELRILCEMAGDSRRATAEAKLMDVENRIRNGGRR